MGPRPIFQFERPAPTRRPARLVAPEPAVEFILGESGAGDDDDYYGVRRELDRSEEVEESMDMFYLNSSVVF